MHGAVFSSSENGWGIDSEKAGLRGVIFEAECNARSTTHPADLNPAANARSSQRTRYTGHGGGGMREEIGTEWATCRFTNFRREPKETPSWPELRQEQVDVSIGIAEALKLSQRHAAHKSDLVP